jgi:Na+-driven multidrug efflux pump
MGLIPTLYTTVRIFFLGQMPDSYSFSIAAQLQWVNLLYEIIQEAFILPLYFFIGKAFVDKQKEVANETGDEKEIHIKRTELTNQVKTGLLIVFGVYTFLSVLIIAFAEPLIGFMQQDVAVIQETVAYIRLETVAAIFATLVKFAMVVLVAIKKDKYLYFVLGLQMVLTILLDMFLISNLSVSAKLGVNGIAITNIIVNVLLLGLAIALLHREDIKVFSKGKLSFAWAKGWVKIGGISGLESFVRNIAFMLMIVRMVNIVGEQGTFWVANNFIWGWLLLPVIQLGELVKRDCGENNREAIRQKTLGYFALTTLFVIIWFISLPLWKPFMHGVLGLDNYNDIFFIVLISVGFYVLFAYNNVIDSIFYGIGKTNYMLFQSIVINAVVYGGAFILWITGIYTPTLVSIALMFAFGTGLDSVLTYGIFAWMLKKEKLNIIPSIVKAG